jgi:glucosamine--fructose-6-phosphate aminotransferase (isomerizing)
VAVAHAARAPSITTLDGAPVERAPKRIDWSPTQAEKGGYKHFMLKEIHEQPRAVEDTLRGRVDDRGATSSAKRWASARSSRRGSAGSASSRAARARTRRWPGATGSSSSRASRDVEIGSEVRYRDPVFGPRRSRGRREPERRDARHARGGEGGEGEGAHVLAVANVIDSAIPRASDAALYTHAGPEIGVASTKCFTTQLAALLLLAVHLGRRRGTLAGGEGAPRPRSASHVPQQMRDVLARRRRRRHVAKKFMRVGAHALSSGAAPATRSRSKARSSSRRSRTSTPRATPPGR